jgi:uncharacterized protein YjiS (DUF1127 family)
MKEMIMSTISSTTAQRDIAVSGFLVAMGRAMVRWWAAHQARRMERTAITCLRMMSDRELKDIGICWPQIDFAVKGRLGTRPLLNRYS